ncbi:MAG TPA: SUMF1/EgtB/PvdO family nonheme iron enzyme [Bryobacteraceae bacterium]|nr:SUMF1/EgtB/PvdO family nonheme iron enzyme [Bryobacteraceae bacterium]
MTPNDLVLIPGGEFLMGQENGRDEEQPVHRVAVAPFRLCRFQVTNREFAAFRKFAFECATLPATSVNWFDAVEYCRWLSAEWGREVRLPTEAEWEFAARGGLEQKLYPWGDEPVTSRAGYAERWIDGPEPVGKSEPNGYGLFDMCENVHEWCSDWYDPRYYDVSPVENPRGPESGTRRASRGGAWRHHIKIARCAARSSIPPEFRYADYGLRVAAGA